MDNTGIDRGQEIDNPNTMADPEDTSGWARESSLGSRTFVTEAAYRPRPAQPTNPTLSAEENALAIRAAVERAFPPPSSPTNGIERRDSRTTESPRASKIHAESADEMVLRLSNEFTPVVDPDWDTVIYIGPPPQEHRQDNHEYEYIRQHFSNPYLMNSQKLKDLGSSQFTKFLGPMSARSERKLKKLGVHNLIPKDRKPKYYIDLRPMQDEDEAILMITELTCSPGVLSWHISHLASGVPKTLINGRDDLNITSKPFAGTWMDIDDSAVNDLEDDIKDGRRVSFAEDGDGILGLEPEYSALRHYVAIERLLHAVAGRDPKLNSAPKVWTYFAIAKFFDCLNNSRVTCWIYEWLFTTNNSNFIQANPEVAYRMALGMRSPDILRTTYTMLVGERALMQASRMPSESFTLNAGNRHISVHGRSTAHLDDDEINRLDHAAHSLTRRVTRFFDMLTNHFLGWATNEAVNPGFDSELAKFEFLREKLPQTEYIEEVWTLLQDYIRGEIYQALSQNVSEGDLMRLYRTKGYREFGWLKRSRAFADAYNAMPLPQRILTQSFWSQLENYGLYQEREKVLAWSRSHSLYGINDLAPELDGAIDCVSKTNLSAAIEAMNSRLKKEKKWEQLDDRFYAQSSPTQFDEEATHVPFPTTNQEVSRALKSLSQDDDDDISGPEWKTDMSTLGTGAAGYPFDSVANDHRYSGRILKVRPAMLFTELSMKMRKRIMHEILTPGYASNEVGIETEISISQMDILLCLNDDEWKYLPLWAGGLDDGSGGVFAEEDVPDMEAIEGFRGGKMGLGSLPGHVGSVGGSFSMASDSEDYDEVMTDEGVSTIGKASRIATDGTTSAGASTVMSLDE